MADVPAASSAAPVTPAGSSPAPSAPAPSAAPLTPASASVTPESPSASAPASPGPIPYERFKEVNDQLRIAKQFQEQYGWIRQAEHEPLPFFEQLWERLEAHPEHSKALLARAARLLNSRRGSTTASASPPDIPIVDAQGNVVTTLGQALAERLQERLAPIEQFQKTLEQREALTQIQQQSTHAARTTLDELRQNPLFTEHEAKVKQALIDHEEWGDNVHRAFNHVLQTEILPKLSQTEQTKVLTHLKTQAAGATVSPSAAASTATPKFKDFGEALRYYADHPDEAAAMAKR